ncbi:MAG: ChaN family lipoprotein [Phycisphaerae bacterium]|nr:ChaN family lipoprotein [Phycisphaerae bacterium]
MNKLLPVALCGALALLLSVGCAGMSAKPVATGPTTDELNAGRHHTVFRGSDGTVASWEEMVSAAAGAAAVLVGENHGHPRGLPSAAALFEDLVAKAPNATLAMEFFERHEQADLDDYLADLTKEDAFRVAASRTDGNYPRGHRHMVETAKANHRPVVAANAPRRYVRVARADGYDKLRTLTPEQQRLWRIPDELPTGKYRENFEKVMSAGAAAHGQKEDEAAQKKRIDDTFRSQSLWDWTMADSVARAIQAGRTPTLLVVGCFHINHEGGTVLALRRLAPGAKIVTVSYVSAESSSLRDEDKSIADYVIYVGEDETQKE